MTRTRLAVALLVSILAAGVVSAQPDPRTAAGQLAVCGGAANWNRMTFLEFVVSIETPEGTQGPWLYRWDRSGGYGRLTGPGPDGEHLDVVVDISSRSGGGSRDGEPMAGELLNRLMAWSVQRMSEDILWLTLPLDWGAAGVTLTPLDDQVGPDGRRYPAVLVTSPVGSWDVMLSPETGRIARTVFERAGVGHFTVEWDEWKEHGGVYFASKRTIEESGEVVTLSVLRHGSSPPPDAF